MQIYPPRCLEATSIRANHRGAETVDADAPRCSEAAKHRELPWVLFSLCGAILVNLCLKLNQKCKCHFWFQIQQ